MKIVGHPEVKCQIESKPLRPPYPETAKFVIKTSKIPDTEDTPNLRIVVTYKISNGFRSSFSGSESKLFPLDIPKVDKVVDWKKDNHDVKK